LLDQLCTLMYLNLSGRGRELLDSFIESAVMRALVVDPYSENYQERTLLAFTTGGISEALRYRGSTGNAIPVGDFCHASVDNAAASRCLVCHKLLLFQRVRPIGKDMAVARSANGVLGNAAFRAERAAHAIIAVALCADMKQQTVKARHRIEIRHRIANALFAVQNAEKVPSEPRLQRPASYGLLNLSGDLDLSKLVCGEVHNQQVVCGFNLQRSALRFERDAFGIFFVAAEQDIRRCQSGMTAEVPEAERRLIRK
jgi:hypothetical protein